MGKALGLGCCVAIVAATAGCGGGSDSPGTPAAPAAVTIAGTAVKGAALAGAAVSAKCAVGTGTAVTGADGKYTLTITGASLPCVLKVAGTEGSVFHSVVPGTGTTGSFAANLTPLTEMLLAKVAGTAPATFYSGFGNGTAVPATALTQAIDYLKTALAGVADLTGVNPVADALAVGNPLDLKIDAVMAAFAASGTTLSEVAATIAANPASPTVVSAPLAPAASDCAWLKSGKYRVVNPYETDAKWKAHVLTLDAAAKTVKDQDGVTIPFTSSGSCQYTVDDATETTTVMVSPAGVLVMHTQSKTSATSRSVAVGLPEQVLPLSEFAGTWNIAGWDPASGISTPGFVAQTGEVTVDATGQITAESDCVGLATCTVGTAPFARFAANATAGGFDFIEGTSTNGRVFLFKTLAGKAVLLFVSNDGQFIVGSRKEALGTLPAVGSVNNFRQFQLDGNGTVSILSEDTITITAIDATARTTTRLLASTNRTDTLAYDKPRNGLRYRALNSCSINGVAANCREVVQLPLQGMGITLTVSVGNTNPATAFYQVTVNKPS